MKNSVRPRRLRAAAGTRGAWGNDHLNMEINNLEAELKRITDEIAALSRDAAGRKGVTMDPRRPAPSGATARIAVLNRQLATTKLKLVKAKTDGQ
ncbi:MAG: hypothetical protein R3D29_14345 [Nitratireductor sp.]